MDTPTNVVRLRQPGEIDDPLTEVLRTGARHLLAQAVELEAEAFLAAMQDLRLPDGRARLVRHGHGPDRAIQTGIGPVPVARVRIRDRGASSPEERIRFSSTILPKWARRTRSLDALLPVLYLRGISTGDFQDALAALLSKDAPNLSPAVITRLTATWADEYAGWQARDLSARHYVYVWADGVYLQARMEEQTECMLVLIGATPEGKKELVGFQVGGRESAQSWRELLVDLEAHLDAWTRDVADLRVHGTTGEAPRDRFAREEARALTPLAGKPPFLTARDLLRRVSADCAVSVDGNAYWVPPQLIGEQVRVSVSEATVRIHHGSREVAVHAALTGRHGRANNNTHLAGLVGSRQPPAHCLAPFSLAPVPAAALLRPLSEYEAVAGGGF